MAFIQTKTKLLYGFARVLAKNNGQTIRLVLKVKNTESSTKDNVVYDTHKFDYDKKEFFDQMPKGVKSFEDPEKFYACAISQDGKKIFQFKPYNQDFVVVRLKGFFRNDKGEIVINEGFKDKKQLTAIFELEVVRGEWAGVIYPYRYWSINDKKTYEPVFKVENHDIKFGYISKPMQTLIEASGVIERAPECPLADTDDQEVILEWLEKQMLVDKNLRIAVMIKEGYPDFDHFEVLDDEESNDEAAVTNDEDDDDFTPPSSSKKFDEDD